MNTPLPITARLEELSAQLNVTPDGPDREKLLATWRRVRDLWVTIQRDELALEAERRPA